MKNIVKKVCAMLCFFCVITGTFSCAESFYDIRWGSSIQDIEALLGSAQYIIGSDYIKGSTVMNLKQEIYNYPADVMYCFSDDKLYAKLCTFTETSEQIFMEIKANLEKEFGVSEENSINAIKETMFVFGAELSESDIQNLFDQCIVFNASWKPDENNVIDLLYLNTSSDETLGLIFYQPVNKRNTESNNLGL